MDVILVIIRSVASVTSQAQVHPRKRLDATMSYTNAIKYF